MVFFVVFRRVFDILFNTYYLFIYITANNGNNVKGKSLYKR